MVERTYLNKELLQYLKRVVLSKQNNNRFNLVSTVSPPVSNSRFRAKEIRIKLSQNLEITYIILDYLLIAKKSFEA